MITITGRSYRLRNKQADKKVTKQAVAKSEACSEPAK